jgi:hypothetical protein
MAETFPLAKAYVASGRMMNNEARFRFVLVAGQREFVTSERL